MTMQIHLLFVLPLLLCSFLSLIPCATGWQFHLCDDLELDTQINIFSLFPIILFSYFYLTSFIHLLYIKFLKVRYFPFDVDLSINSRQISCDTSTSLNLWFVFLGIIINEMSYEILIAWFTHVTPSLYPFFVNIFRKVFLIRKTLQHLLICSVTLYLMAIATTPVTHILSFVIMLISCNWFTKNVPLWIPLLLILLSNDIELNPGPLYHENFFTFMNWNLNSIVKNNFERINLIEAHNSLFNYDIISLCETSLNDTVEIPDPLLKDYTFISANHPDNVSHGGVGLFYKNSLPIKNRSDLSFAESLVVELKFGRKKIFFTVIYRSPSVKCNSPKFDEFLTNFQNLNAKIQAEKPYATFFTGDFNGHSQLWWSDGDTTPEGKKIEELLSELNLSQVISEPTNFTPGKNPSCIDLLITDQPNIILNSGTRSSLDPKCHHQIIHGKINFKIPPPPPMERKMWHYNKANTDAIKKSMSCFPWAKHLSINTDINW